MTNIVATSTDVETRSTMTAVQEWFKQTFIDPFRQLRWSFLPPLMVYFAAGRADLPSAHFLSKSTLGYRRRFSPR
jgi:hypothetical protein